MVQKFLQNTAFMCIFIALGVISWIAASLVSKWWVAILFMVVALFDFFIARVSYRRAKKIANALDFVYDSLHKQVGFHLQLFKIIFPDKKTEPEAEHDENEGFGHPV